MKRFAAISTMTIILSGCASIDSQVDEYYSLTKEHFRDTATVHDDSLETVATISTFEGFQLKQGMMKVVWNDEFLRAFIDKKSGEVSYQLYNVLRYRDNGWYYYNRVNYRDAKGGVQSVTPTVLKRDVDCSNSGSGGCKYEEHVAVILDDATFRNLARQYNPSESLVLKYKVGSQSGQEFSGSVLASEAAGLVERVEAYKAANGIGNQATK